jgi:integrase
MSCPSISCQVDRCLKEIILSKEEQDAMKEKRGVASLKKANRPNNDPKRLQPYIYSKGTAKAYFRSGRTFFHRAKELTGLRFLSEMLNRETILSTFNAYYADVAPGTASKIQAAIKHIFDGAIRLGWVSGPCPINYELSDQVATHMRAPRYGYHPEDAYLIIDELNDRDSRFALPAEIALYCGLREDEIAGLTGDEVDREQHLLSFKGKGGRHRIVPIPVWLIEKLPPIKTNFFTAKESWCANFRMAVQKVCLENKIGQSGVHRLRATYAQLKYTEFRIAGMDDRQAREAISVLLGHDRVDVTFHYVPKDFDHKDFVPYLQGRNNDEDQG